MLISQSRRFATFNGSGALPFSLPVLLERSASIVSLDSASSSSQVCYFVLVLASPPLSWFLFAANVKDLHDDALRELAVNQLEPHRCASGGAFFSCLHCRLWLAQCRSAFPGHDRKLCVFDLNEMRVTNVIKLPDVIGSVKWPEFNQSERRFTFVLAEFSLC
jgi:hypothetical protein